MIMNALALASSYKWLNTNLSFFKMILFFSVSRIPLRENLKWIFFLFLSFSVSDTHRGKIYEPGLELSKHTKNSRKRSYTST